MVSFKKAFLIGAILSLFGSTQAQEKCQICLHGSSDGLCFMAQVGTKEDQAPFVGNGQEGPVTLSSFTGADGGWCNDCVLTAYSSNNFGGRSQVLDFGEDFQFSLNFCAKSYRLECTKVRYDPPGYGDEEEEEEEEEEWQEGDEVY